MKPIDQPETLEGLYALIRKYHKVAITGHPGAGKTTLSNRNVFGIKKVIHTDDYLKYPRSQIPSTILEDLHGLKDYIVEGTQVPMLFELGWQPDILILVTGSKRTDCKGIGTMINNRIKNCNAWVITVNPRELT